jgi:hypothetical protein
MEVYVTEGKVIIGDKVVILPAGTYELNGDKIMIEGNEVEVTERLENNEDFSADENWLKEEKKVLVIGDQKNEKIGEALSGMDIEYITNEEADRRARAESLDRELSDEEKVLQQLMPASGMIEDFIFGPPKRLKDEPQAFYKHRMRIEKKVLKLRQSGGVNAWNTKEKGQYTDPLKQAKKENRKIKSANRIRLSRQQRKEMGLL